MQDPILNADELAALRAAVDAGAPDELLGPASPNVRTDGESLPRHRFGQRPRSRQRADRFALVGQRAARAFEKRLADALAQSVDVRVSWLDETRFDAFRAAFELDVRDPVAMAFGVDGCPEPGIMVVEPELVEPVIETMMGGAALAGGPSRRAPRPLTEFDLRLSRRWMTGLLDDLAFAWNPDQPLRLSAAALDGTGVAARSRDGKKEVLGVILEVSAGRRTVGMVGLVLPAAAGDGLGEPVPPPADRERAALLPALPSCPVAVTVDLGSVRMTVRELLALAAGDVVSLDPASVAVARVEGVAKLAGVAGTSSGVRAFCVTEVPHRSETHA
jgi:flagellar motor switch protein FliM